MKGFLVEKLPSTLRMLRGKKQSKAGKYCTDIKIKLKYFYKYSSKFHLNQRPGPRLYSSINFKQVTHVIYLILYAIKNIKKT